MSTPDLAAALKQLKPSPHAQPGCALCRVLHRMPAREAAAVRDAVANPEINARQIADALTAHGWLVELSDPAQVVYKHRRRRACRDAHQ